MTLVNSPTEFEAALYNYQYDKIISKLDIYMFAYASYSCVQCVFGGKRLVARGIHYSSKISRERAICGLVLMIRAHLKPEQYPWFHRFPRSSLTNISGPFLEDCVLYLNFTYGVDKYTISRPCFGDPMVVFERLHLEANILLSGESNMAKLEKLRKQKFIYYLTTFTPDTFTVDAARCGKSYSTTWDGGEGDLDETEEACRLTLRKIYVM